MNDNGFRKHYKNGVKEFYLTNGMKYYNPHHSDISTGINFLFKIKNNINKILDLCAGGGEVTKAVLYMKYNVNIVGADPFTYKLYEFNTKLKCYKWSFDDIMEGCIDEQFDMIICSYALHLCEKNKLYNIMESLSRSTKYLCVISPFKLPYVCECIVKMNFVKEEEFKCGKARFFIYKFS